jgi:hypothetical protein
MSGTRSATLVERMDRILATRAAIALGLLALTTPGPSAQKLPSTGLAVAVTVGSECLLQAPPSVDGHDARSAAELVNVTCAEWPNHAAPRVSFDEAELPSSDGVTRGGDSARRVMLVNF